MDQDTTIAEVRKSHHLTGLEFLFVGLCIALSFFVGIFYGRQATVMDIPRTEVATARVPASTTNISTWTDDKQAWDYATAQYKKQPTEGGGTYDCATMAGGQSQLNICSGFYSEYLSLKLDEAYQSIARLFHDPEQLKDIQKRWNDLAQSFCTLYASGSEGGSIHALVFNGCMSGLLKDQIKLINSLTMNPVKG